MQANGTSQASQPTGADKQDNTSQAKRPGGTRTRRARTGDAARTKGARSKKVKPTTAKAEKAKVKANGPREGSTIWAAMEVLRGRRNPMTAREIYAEIKRRSLAPGLKGKTPEQTVAAALAVHAKRGAYVQRAGRGKFRLRKGS